MCVGDVHGQWDAGDEAALGHLRPDVALFVGDYGNEDVRVVGRIAALAEAADYGVATVFGNHDAFYTAHAYGRSNAPAAGSRVVEQRRALADTDVSYRARQYGGVWVVGGRPFSWGGPHWKHGWFYRRHVGMSNMAMSEEAITGATRSVPAGAPLVMLSHVGPTGLGTAPSAPCGRDWGPQPGGDWGDPDLRGAIDRCRKDGRRVSLVLFGHMHRELRGGGRRTMLTHDGDTLMLNAAVVPRHRLWGGLGKMRHFVVAELHEDEVRRVDEVWLTPGGERISTTQLYAARSCAVS